MNIFIGNLSLINIKNKYGKNRKNKLVIKYHFLVISKKSAHIYMNL